jgi:hypothetical protein
LIEHPEQVKADDGNDIKAPAAKRRKLSPQEDTVFLKPPTPDAWLPPTLAEDFRNHSPVGMFSEGQSTVPDNTIQIQQIAQQLSQYESPRNGIVNNDHKSSIPWTDLMNLESDAPTGSPPFERIDEPPRVELVMEEHAKLLEESHTPPGTPIPPKSKSTIKHFSKISRKKAKKRKISLPDSEDELSMVEQPIQFQDTNVTDAADERLQKSSDDHVDVSPDFLPKGKVMVFVPQAPSAGAIQTTEEIVKEQVDQVKELKPQKQEPAPKSKKRGRPRKNLPKPENASVEEPAVIEETTVQPDEDNVAAGPLQKEAGEPQEPAFNSHIETKENIPPVEKKSVNIEKPMARGSPIGNGKQLHRVGLSRMVRIAPLLKVVRK